MRGNGVDFWTFRIDAKPRWRELARNVCSQSLTEPSLLGSVGNVPPFCAASRAGPREAPGH